MSDIIQNIADSYQTIQRLSQLLRAVDGAAPHPLLADLELQFAKIEFEAARLWQENIELRRSSSNAAVIEPAKLRISHPTPQSTDVRQTMQKVSQFYQMYSREKALRKSA